MKLSFDFWLAGRRINAHRRSVVEFSDRSIFEPGQGPPGSDRCLNCRYRVNEFLGESRRRFVTNAPACSELHYGRTS
jgi:hypothetical protein